MIGRIIVGRYKIIRQIGQGTFGTTYLAEDTQIPAPNECIVKHFTPSITDPEVLKKAKELFEREAKTLNQLGKHPQIPRLLAHIQENQD
ncbi:MAG: serine/threonine protein kinase, partial [Nostocales cyanobacterium]